jgi:hypothetical protein
VLPLAAAPLGPQFSYVGSSLVKPRMVHPLLLLRTFVKGQFRGKSSTGL